MTRINWRPRRLPDALIAEAVITENCRGSVRLIHQPMESRPWLVTAEVICDGFRPWSYERRYQRMPSAVWNLITTRDRATALLRRNSRQP